MGRCMKICRFRAALLFVLLISLPGFAQDTSVSEQQAEAVRQVMVALNRSSNEIGQQIFSEPQRAAEAGCLDGIKGIDLSVFTVDFTSAWSALTREIKDRILNGTCSAASDWANDQTAALETSMEGPMGMGSITLSQGTAIDDWQSVTREDVELSEAELNTKVTTGTLGQVPARTIPTPGVAPIQSTQDTPSSNKEAIEAEFPEILKFKQLWKDPE